MCGVRPGVADTAPQPLALSYVYHFSMTVPYAPAYLQCVSAAVLCALSGVALTVCGRYSNVTIGTSPFGFT